MNLDEKLLNDQKQAMKSGETLSLETIRPLRSALKYAAIAKQGDLTEEEGISVLSKEVKKRKEAIELYKKGGREELAQKEEKEMAIILGYLPKALSGEEIEQMVVQAIQDAQASSIKDLGKVMGRVMSLATGRVDGKSVQELVKKKLGG